MTRRIGCLAEKGGTGKTVTALNLAAAFGAQELRVLLVDLDAQANASHVLLRGAKPEPPTVADTLLNRAELVDAIRPTHFANVDVLPSSAELADTTAFLTNEVARERRLAVSLAPIAEEYDVVLLDTAPTRSVLTANALAFVEEVYVPLVPSLFGVLGLGQLQADIATVKQYLGHARLRLAGVILCAMERNRICAELEAQLRDMLGAVVLETTIPKSVKVEEANNRAETVLTWAPRNPAALAYRKLAEEILTHGAIQTIGDQHPARRPGIHGAA
jgi:chromosome partitioning protein